MVDNNAALIVYVGATNVINFMDGINGITTGYSLAVLIPLALVNMNSTFVEESLIISTILASIGCSVSLIFDRKVGLNVLPGMLALSALPLSCCFYWVM